MKNKKKGGRRGIFEQKIHGKEEERLPPYEQSLRVRVRGPESLKVPSQLAIQIGGSSFAADIHSFYPYVYATHSLYIPLWICLCLRGEVSMFTDDLTG